MPNTYTQLHLQIVFAVKYRQALICIEWEDRMYQYISGIIRKLGHKLLVINGMPDHIHLLIGLRPNQALSEMMRIVKGESSEWINKMNLTNGVFRWQEGYGAFSYSKNDLPRIINYIGNQKQHHSKVRFREEYETLLNEFEVEYNPIFLFKEPE